MKNVLEYLERNAERFPDRPAFADERESISFSALREQARRIGTELARRDCRCRPAAILAEKSVRTAALMLGIVYAGGFYVMLDPAQPADRLNRILEVTEPQFLIVSGELRAQADRLEGPAERLAAEDLGRLPEDGERLQDIRDRQLDTDPLYMLFTSGSTGVPKGVVVGHRSVISFIDAFVRIFGFSGEDVIGNQAPWDFDISVKDFYGGLCSGACVQLIPRRLFSVPVQLLDYLEDKKITSLTWAVSALTLVSALDGLSYKAPPLRRILFSGEVMPVRDLNYWKGYYPETLFANLYGPTEITCNCCYYIVDRDFAPGGILPMGQTFPNVSVFLLDEQDHRITEPGREGEICIGGAGLALGYWRQREMTARVFVQNPLNDRYDERIYRSGDMGYYNERGELCFSARRDFQIKHMGHRIELGEIEHALERVKEVKESCCLFDADRRRLVCFYRGEIDKRELSRALGEYLPDFMVPGTYRRLEDGLPRNKNGKIDRTLLKAMLSRRGEKTGITTAQEE